MNHTPDKTEPTDNKSLESSSQKSAQISAQALTNVLIKEIQNGSLEIDDYYPSERALGIKYGVSRTVVREALLILELKGFAALANSHRPKVRKPDFIQLLRGVFASIEYLSSDLELLANLEQARQMIELSVVSHIAQHATDMQLIRIIEQHHRSYELMPDRNAFRQADIAFHRCLMAALDNPILTALHEAIVGTLFERRVRLEQKQNLTLHETVFTEHAAIVEAVKARDPEQARQMLGKHLTRAYQVYRDAAIEQRSSQT